jgi:hypothetical protein
MQALSQLSYSPIRVPVFFNPVPGTEAVVCVGGGLILLLLEDGKPKSSPDDIFLTPGEKSCGKSGFVVVANADDAGDVVVLIVFVCFEERVVVIVEFYVVIAFDIWNVVTAGVAIGVFQRHEFDFRVFGIDFGDFFLFGLLFHFLGSGRFFEEGKRPGLAGVWGHDRIAVQVVEFLAGIRVCTLGAKVRFCHCLSLEL